MINHNLLSTLDRTVNLNFNLFNLQIRFRKDIECLTVMMIYHWSFPYLLTNWQRVVNIKPFQNLFDIRLLFLRSFIKIFILSDPSEMNDIYPRWQWKVWFFRESMKSKYHYIFLSGKAFTFGCFKENYDRHHLEKLKL